MKHYQHFHGFLVGVGLMALFIVLAVTWSLQLPTTSARAAQLLAEKPVAGWYVCRDLGIGSVPGLPDLRQRLRLCHDDGWTINTYCTQPGLPVPPLGRSCTRIGEEKFSCGANDQILRAYHILATPDDTPTPTVTSTHTSTLTPNATPTHTSTLTTSATSTHTSTLASNTTPTHTSIPPVRIATKTPTPRVPTGGEGNAAQVRALVFTEISIFILALGVGIWFFRRMENFD